MTFERGSPHFLHFPSPRASHVAWFDLQPLIHAVPCILYVYLVRSLYLYFGRGLCSLSHTYLICMCACIDSLVRCNKPTHALLFCIDYCGYHFF